MIYYNIGNKKRNNNAMYIGWVLMNESPTVATYYRNEANSPCHSIKMIGVVNSPLFNIVALVNEVDLYRTWIPFLKVAKQISGTDLRY